MKAILISIKPRFVAKILNGEKTIEIRKTMPKCDLPIDVYIYCTKENTKYYIENKIYNSMINGKVVAKFTLNKVEEIKHDNNGSFYYPYGNIRFMTDSLNEHQLLEKSCLLFGELDEYLYPNNYKGYAWHISNLEVFDRPKELSEFEKVGSYNNPTIKCKKKEQGRCNYGKSPFTGKWVGCEKARLTKAPQSWQFIEVKE